MAHTIGTQSYPEDVLKIMAHSKLGKLFRAFVKSRMAEENTNFIDEVNNSFDPKRLYPKFISPSSSTRINVSSGIRKQAQALAEAKDFKNKAWRKVIEQLVNEVDILLTNNYLDAFWKYKPFLEHHNKQATKKMGDPSKAAALLGIKDTKDVEAFMVAHVTGNRKDIKTTSIKLTAKPELKKKKVKENAITKMLRKAKLI